MNNIAKIAGGISRLNGFNFETRIFNILKSNKQFMDMITSKFGNDVINSDNIKQYIQYSNYLASHHRLKARKRAYVHTKTFSKSHLYNLPHFCDLACRQLGGLWRPSHSD